MNEAKLFTTNEVAKILGVNAETIRRWVRQEKIFPTDRSIGRVGSKFSWEDIVEFAKNSEIQTYMDRITLWSMTNNVSTEEVSSNENHSNDEEPSLTSKLIEEKLNLIELKKKLAEITAEISKSECRIEQYELLLMKEN